jgi:hypothetical protein
MIESKSLARTRRAILVEQARDTLKVHDSRDSMNDGHFFADDADGSPRIEIAVLAARLIADHGLDYRAAKQKATREVFGTSSVPRNSQPSNEDIDRALREHLNLFDPEHEQRVARMRAVAIVWMKLLAAFKPLATGAVWKGLASEHTVIHLQLFHDNGKEVPYFLIDRGIDFEATAVSHFRRGGDVEAYQFVADGETIVLAVYDFDDIKGALRLGHFTAGDADRGDLAALLARIDANDANDANDPSDAP